uniref:ORF42e n=1 Tax=Pinus thunbergii TaxID=3350 RepID=Q32984_PINTH|nr:ORF42e [Pinus thunbergii]
MDLLQDLYLFLSREGRRDHKNRSDETFNQQPNREFDQLNKID